MKHKDLRKIKGSEEIRLGSKQVHVPLAGAAKPGPAMR